MKILKLQLQNFRSYEKIELKFNKNKPITLILGKNGKGKTNLLESAYFLSTGKTFQNAEQDNLIKWGMDFFSIKGEAEIKNEKTDLEILYSIYPRRQKAFKINEVITPHAKYLGNLITVLFHPKDLNMLYLEPSLRRKYVNLLLSQTDKYYLESLSSYTKLIKQRNALLEEISEGTKSKSELDIWDDSLAIEAANITLKRMELINFFNKHIQSLYQKISGGKEKIEIKYLNTTNQNDAINQDGISQVKSIYLKKLILKRDKDIRFGTTSVGPHRDDIKFILNGHHLEESASRGECRTLLIALKAMEIKYIEKKIKEKPILLLDDVLSELDNNRQKHLFDIVEGCQVIITATEAASDIIDKKTFNVVKI